MKYNCPNCGAVVEYDLHKCPYCGTSYFDMSCIDFEQGTPVYLKLKLNQGGNPIYITQLVMPKLTDIEATCDYIEYTNPYGQVLHRMRTGQRITTNLSFEAIPMQNREMMIATYEKE